MPLFSLKYYIYRVEDKPVVYPSKISLAIVLFFVAIFGYIAYTTLSAGKIAPVIILGAMFAFIVLGLLFNTRYIINGTDLQVKSGFIINLHIDINSITKIIENNGIISAPAASFDRIEVFYNKYDSVVISPRDKKLFAEALKQINPNIVITL